MAFERFIEEPDSSETSTISGGASRRRPDRTITRQRGGGTFVPRNEQERQSILNKEQLANETAAQAEKARADLQGMPLSRQEPIGAASALQRQFKEGTQATISYAAERGLLTSSYLDQRKRNLLRENALQRAGMEGAAEMGYRGQIQKAAGEVALASKSREDIPDEVLLKQQTGFGPVDAGGMVSLQGKKDIYSHQTNRIEKANTKSREVLVALAKNRPTEQQLMQDFSGHINEIYSGMERSMLEDAAAKGHSAAYVEGLRRQMASDREQTLAEMVDVARTLAGPDPAMAQSVLSAIYTPDRIDMLEQDQISPMWGVGGGMVGAVAGAYIGKTPASTAAGYEIGSAAGQGAGSIYG